MRTVGHICAGAILAAALAPGARRMLKVGRFNVDVDFNHPLAGKTLVFDIEIVDVRDATPARFVDATGADEIMAVSAIHDHAARLASYELLAQAAGD
jgi:FKBP-type peptidyl-prolyl cis-trans isomerase 2